ncbi:hypothetical protein Ahy_B05g076427 [Arachis hypogaea]|uniref:hAT-like transposase RNase-H fold domain-containing protein n=1 Tax=Arachis hypogaea TaxID=3818 RepID=A0A444Z393_ARAHY|nr:hypothetical protein Ahy_B05g076427 [Arachis hypogaea]
MSSTVRHSVISIVTLSSSSASSSIPSERMMTNNNNIEAARISDPLVLNHLFHRQIFVKIGQLFGIILKFKVLSWTTLARDIGAFYAKQQMKLQDFLSTNYGRVCLTTNTWTSIQNFTYMSLTAHFVFSVTVDNASSNNIVIKYLKHQLSSWNSILLNGLKEIDESVLRIYSTVKYVRSFHLKPLEVALKHCKAFELLALKDNMYT